MAVSPAPICPKVMNGPPTIRAGTGRGRPRGVVGRHMDHLPLFLDLRGRRVVIVGGGVVAHRKAELLLEAGAELHVVAPELEPALAAMAAHGRIHHRAAPFAPGHLDGAALAIAATGDRAINAVVAAAARERNIFVNAVDDPAASTCLMPAIVDRSPLLVAVGTSGNAPVLARLLRARLETLLPRALGAVAAAAGRAREAVRARIGDGLARRRFWEDLLESATDVEPSAAVDPAALDALIARRLDEGTGAAARGEVWLIGAGPGDPELLTLRAFQLLQRCDVVLYDRLVPDSILACVRREAERIFVGKESGHHRTTQQHIHELLLEHAAQGRRVARLKGGDPFVFGRGGEEIGVLLRAGVPVTVVPGVTAALGAAAAAVIPLTHRGLAHAVVFVTAMGEAAAALDWTALAAPLQTAVFYMGVAQLPHIVERLRAHGAPADRPVAIVERATLPGQRVVAGELATIVARASAAAVAAPALLIVGEVARFAAHGSESVEGGHGAS